jgi:hypothetical protein
MSHIDELLAAATPLASPVPATTDWVPIWNLGSPPSPITGAMQVISDQQIGVAASSISFQSIPQNFVGLRLVLSLRDSGAGTVQTVNMRANNDAGNNYSASTLAVSGSGSGGVGTTTALGEGISTARVGRAPAASAVANYFSQIVIDIYDYTSAVKFKAYTAQTSSKEAASGGMNIEIDSGVWASLAAITRLDIFPGSTFLAGSRATLYGIGATNLTPALLTPPAVVTSLPASPLDTQQVILCDNASNPTWQTLCQWSQAANRWMLLGSPLVGYNEATADVSTTGALVAVLYTPTFTVPACTIQCEFYAPSYTTNQTAAQSSFWMYLDGTQVGASNVPLINSGQPFGPVVVRRRLAVSAGSHQFGIQVNSSNGTMTVKAGNGVGAMLPMTIRAVMERLT